MSINRNLATFAKDVQTDGSLKGIAVTVTVAGGKFVIDGTSQQDMFLPKGVKYRFDVSDSTNANHPLRFSTTSDGTHGSGSAYTTGVTTSGTAGSSGAYVEVQLQQDAPDQLYYYCGNHSGMGAGAETAPVAVSSYGNSDVDTHLNTSGASSGQLLGWNGSDYAWVADSDTSGIDNIVEDTSPHLGGSLDVNGQSIVSASNGNIAITPNGTGKVVIDGLSHPTADGTANQVLKTDGSGNLSFTTMASGGLGNISEDTTPQLGGDLDVQTNSIVSTSNRDIAITPNGSGKVVIDGLSYPQADGNADEVLKTDGSGNLSFVAQSSGGGGGTLNATASGTLANGDMVIVNADGTVSKIGTESASQALGTTANLTGSPNFATYVSSAYDEASGKVVIAYQDTGNSNYGTCQVGTVSGTNITFGAAVVFESASTSWISATYDASAQKIVIFYSDAGNNSYGTAIVGSVSGSSISFGSPTVFDNEVVNYVNSTYDSNAQKVVCSFYHNAVSGAAGQAVVGTVSGSAISFGSPVSFYGASAIYIHIAYDSNAQKVLITYRDNPNSNRGDAVVGTVSGSSISFGSIATFESGYMMGGALAYDANAQKLVIAYRDQNASGVGVALVATISGTSVSFGAKSTFQSGGSGIGNDSPRVVYDSNSQKTIISYRDQNASSCVKIIEATISGTSLSYGTAVAMDSGENNPHTIAYGGGKAIITFRDVTHNGGSSFTYVGQARVFQGAYSITRALTSENFIGVSDAAYSDGATATIQTAGSKDDAQSGLTAGQSYYVQADGTLGLSPDTIEVLAGTAVSATEILINPDTNPATFGINQVDAHLNVSGASSGQILSWNGSDYAWTDDATGAGSITATASGALTDGSTVAINADGTVSIIKAAVSQSIGTAVQYDNGTSTGANGNAIFGKAAYDTNSNRVVVAYRNTADSGHGYAVVGTVSGSSISWGTPVEFRGAGIDHIAISFDSSANKVLIIYRDYGNSYHGYAVVGTVSNTAISFGSVTNFEAGLTQYTDIAFDTNANKHLIVYQDYHDNSYGKGIVATISGTSVSFGTAVTFVTNEANWNTVTYDSTAQKFLVSWCKGASVAEAAVATISGTSVSFGSTATVASGYYQYMSSAFDSGASKHIIAYADTGGSYNGNVKVGTISGTSVSFGSAAVVDTNTDSLYHFALSYNSASDKTLFVYNKGGNTGSGYYNIGTVSGTSISFGTSAVFEDGHVVSGNDVIYDPTTEKNILLFSDMDDNAKGKAIVFTQALSGGATLTAENFVGISDGAYASGATATIQTSGSIDDAQSGLTAGQTYYVQAATGALGLSPDTISVVAGTAISATKLLINPDSDPTITAYTDSDVNSHLNVSGASANQVLSWNGSDYAWTDDATGAGSITATASGALANGQMVVLNSDGTVSAVADSTQAFSAGTPAVAYSSSIAGDPTIVYHSAANKLLAVYKDSSSNTTYASLGTVSGTSITFANQVTFESSNNIDYLAAAYDSNSEAVVCCYRKLGAPFYFGAKAMTVSGTTITVGSERNLLSQQVGFCDVVFDSNVNRFVFAALDFDNSYALKTVVGTVSGTTISSGSAQTIHSATYAHQMVFDSGSNKVIIVYRDNANSLYGAARVLDVASGSNSIATIGNATFYNSDRSDNPRVGYDANANKSIVLYTDYNNSEYQTLQVGTVSGTSISFGSKITGFHDLTIAYRDIVYDPDNQNMALFMRRNVGALDDTVYFPVTISGTSATVGSASEILGASDEFESYGRNYITYDTTANKFALFFKNTDDSQAQGVAVQTPFDGSTNLTDENFLGVSDGSYGNGATATIQTAGAVDDAQSSLTPAQTYFVQSTGGIGLTPSSPSVVAGTAISATQLLVKSGQPIEKPNTTPLVASGALSDGTKVCINSDGTVSAITETSASSSIGSTAVFNSGNMSLYQSSVYDANSGKVVVAYRNGYDYYGNAVVGTISGNTITFGTPVVFESANTQGLDIGYDANAQKVVIAYRDGGNSSRGTAIVGTISGTSVSFGSAAVFDTGSTYAEYSVTYDTAAQKVLIAYHFNFSKGRAVVGTISGTSISFGSSVDFHNGSTNFIGSAYDENAGKHLIAYQAGGNNSYGEAIVGTISGTSVSFGNAAVFENGSDISYCQVSYDTSAQKSLIVYRGTSIDGKARVATISGTSVSFGTAASFSSGNGSANYTAVAYSVKAKAHVVVYRDANNSNYGTLKVGTISGTDVTFGSATVYEAAATWYNAITYDSAQERIVITYSDSGNSGYGTGIVYQPAYLDQNLTATNYVGISDAAYTNGQTATIQVAGATDDAQSGLTAGQLYYVQHNGTLSTTADSPSVIAGTAISATKLIVKG